MKRRILLFILLTSLLSTCIDPFVPELINHESFLVVEGMITDEPDSYTIQLSKTFKNVQSSPVLLSNAEVSVLDEFGTSSVFYEKDPGIYRSDPAEFSGRVGGTYTLHVKTEDGLEYVSDECTMTAVPDIDSVYFEFDKEFYEDATVEEPGLRIYLDTESQDEVSQYLRWEFEEVWEFRVPYPIFYQDLGYRQYKTVPVENDICWKYERSKQILIHSSSGLSSDKISRSPIHFIASGRSNRLLRQYSIQIEQYSVSREEFSFWNQLKEITESGGDIFEKQPFPIVGNIRCVNHADAEVLGFFQVSAVKKKRMYITQSMLRELDIPVYEYPCERIVYRNREFHEILYENLKSDGYVLFWVKESDFPGPPESFQFTSPECSDCSLNGKTEEPDFWVDMD